MPFKFLLFLAAMAIGMNDASAQETVDKIHVTIPSVTSTGQVDGVTAGYVGQLNQTILPTLVRGPLLNEFKKRYTEGARLYRTLGYVPMNDDNIMLLCIAMEQWYTETYNWLEKVSGPWSAERFAFTAPSLGDFRLNGEHRADVQAKVGNLSKLMPLVLQNLDQLMREPSIYPEK